MTVPPGADRVLCIVPARGGSRRIIGKNLQEVGGVPLVARAVGTALEAFGRVFVSTDDADIAAVAIEAGAAVPELRPGKLASDDATMDAVVEHAVEHWASEADDVAVVAQATSPFTTAEDLRSCVEALRSHPDAATAMLGVVIPPTHSFAVKAAGDVASPLAPDLFDARSQDLPNLWLPTGGAFCVPVDRIRNGGRLLQVPFAIVEVPPERALDIDDVADLERARADCPR